MGDKKLLGHIINAQQVQLIRNVALDIADTRPLSADHRRNLAELLNLICSQIEMTSITE